MTLQEFIDISEFADDSKFQLLCIKAPIKTKSNIHQSYGRMISVQELKLSLVNFNHKYIKPESEIKSFYFFDDRIQIILKDYEY